MKIEVLEKGISILNDIKVAESRIATLRKLYNKKQKLNKDDIENLFAIGTSSTEHIIELKNRDLDSL